jgi:excinuclease ABC subunit C
VAVSETLAQLPDTPGVYLMVDANERILYIGKAVSLRNRVRSYFQESAALAPRVRMMVERVVDVRTIVVSNEVEALILEANLIKRHQPQFNVRLRDDKRYPYLKVTREPFPRLLFTRAVRDDGARYFGPFTDARGLRELIDLIRALFPLRTCREPIDGKRPRPCLQYHIKRCLAPCVGYQSELEYDALVAEVVLFLEGRQDALLDRLERDMREASEGMRYESAAMLRDRIQRVRRIAEGQKVVWRSRIDMDLIAAAFSRGQACMQVFIVRGGKLIGQEHFILEGMGDQAAADSEKAYHFAAFIEQFYTARDVLENVGSSMRVGRENEVPVPLKEGARVRAQSSAIPKVIIIEELPENRLLLERWLSERKGQRVRILQPLRGQRAEYLRLVQRNAEQNLRAFLAHQEARESASSLSLIELAAALDLPDAPRRIECYDISNIQGTNPTASMAVFIEGRAKKSEYRRFTIHYDRGSNDFAMMQEVLRRRLRYLRARNGASEENALLRKEKFHHRPDLLLIDGGKGQLNAVVEVLEELDLQGIPVAGLAKEHEWLFVPRQTEPIVLPPGSPALHLVMRIRDEAHRFAIEHHRNRRGKAMTRSALDGLSGIGTVRKKRLLATFGSVAALKRASLDDIAAVKGMTHTSASQVKAHLHV